MSFHDNIISFLNAYLMGLCDRTSEEDNLNIIKAIKYLCRAEADINVKKVGTYSCSFCFCKFEKEQFEAEIFHKIAQEQNQIKPQIITLQCGHSMHNECFKQLTQDFKEKMANLEFKQYSDCECPGCEEGEQSKIIGKDYFQFVNITIELKDDQPK